MKIVKIIFLCAVFFFISNSYGQILSGKVTYKVQLVGFEEDSKNTEYKDFNKSVSEIANKLTCTLKFNGSQSSAVIDDFLVSESGNSTASKIAFITIAGSNFYIDKKEAYVILERTSGNPVKEPYLKREWEVTTESKKIGDYLCYKAIYLWQFINRKNEQVSIPVIAWFAPSLPYSYGPKGFGDLPGLILELQDRETTYYAVNIEISKEKELKINFPKVKG